MDTITVPSQKTRCIVANDGTTICMSTPDVQFLILRSSTASQCRIA